MSSERIDSLVSVLFAVLATALLLGPIAILATMQEKGLPQVGVIFASILVFAACMAGITQAKKQELFAATAAYAAVLVVFLGNNR